MLISLSGELNFAKTPQALAQASAEFKAAAGVIEKTHKPSALAHGAAEGSAPLVLDLSGVTRADSAGLALLLELTRMALARGGTLQIEKSPPQLRKLAEFFGLDELLAFV